VWDFSDLMSAGDEVPRILAKVDFSGIADRVDPKQWLDLDSVQASLQRAHPDKHVEFDLCPVRRVVGRWAVPSKTVSNYDDLVGAHVLLLAFQGMLMDAPGVELSPGNYYTHAFYLGDQEYLQSVRMFGRRTADRFVLFPMSPSLGSAVRVVTAWNAIGNRAARDDLGLVEVLALTLGATVDIFFDQVDARVNDATTDYAEALKRVEDAARLCLSSGFDTAGFGLRQHFVAWYRYWVPYHWHELLFTSDQIRGFCESYAAINKRTPGGGPPAGHYPHWGFTKYLRDSSSEAGTTEKIDEYAWTGGYQTVVEGLDITLAATWKLICQAWRGLIVAPRVGSASLALIGPEMPASVSKISFDKTRDRLDDDELDLFVAYAAARLRNWATQ